MYASVERKTSEVWLLCDLRYCKNLKVLRSLENVTTSRNECIRVQNKR